VSVLINPASDQKFRVLVSWSSGKDSAWMVSELMKLPQIEIVGLLTTFDEVTDRVAMHGVRRGLVVKQAAAMNLPLWPVMLPWPCTNAEYDSRMRTLFQRAENAGVTHVAYGDLFLEEIRDYRIKKLADTKMTPMFPIWCGQQKTRELAEEMIQAGMQAIITCVDPKQLSADFIGRQFDGQLLQELPAGVDCCGEHGEFHTFCYGGPHQSQAIDVELGEICARDGFVYAELVSRDDSSGC
jgi:uncharacterized protein (TIGR00290 family)